MIPEEPEALQGAMEISTPRGTVRGILYSVEGARGAIVMVGGAGATLPDRPASTKNCPDACRPIVRRPCAWSTARRTTSRSAPTTYAPPSMPWEVGEQSGWCSWAGPSAARW